MKNIKKITSDTMSEFAEKIEHAKMSFIPMLPFIEMHLHDFDRYKNYSEKGIYLIDYIGDEYCLYHLYHLNEGDDTLRGTLILPSSWEKRFEIIEKSIPNVKEWFLTEDTSQRFIIQSLEYGEIEYFPTLSHYLIPTIIRNGFEPKYRMYMKREASSMVSQAGKLEKDLSEIKYSEKILNDLVNFYYKSESTRDYKYFTNCTYEEFLELFKQDFTINNSKFITEDNGKIVSCIVVSKDLGKIWIDNFSVSTQYSGTDIGDYILSSTIIQLSKLYPEETIYIYLNRDCYEAVNSCKKNGFTPFEFWTDMILER